MLEVSQFTLVAATILIVIALVSFIALVAPRKAAAKASVLVGSGGAEAEPAHAAAPRGLAWYAHKLVVLALALMTVGLVTRTLAAGHGPFSNQYEFAISFAWGMTLAFVYFDWRYKVRALALVVLPVILAMLLYATTQNAEPSPLIPALQNSVLLTLHVFTAALAYGAACVSFGAAVLYLIKSRGENRLTSHLPKLETLDEIGYKGVVATFPLLTTMIILGALWADTAWGRYWGWDPKETAAFVTWLIYGAYLHARVVRDWRGTRAAWLLVVGFAAVLFSYFGNHFFGGLHSYG